MESIRLRGKVVVAGKARGLALVSREPLSFWGGYDWRTGEVTDRRHELSGQMAAGKILALPFTRGSSTTTAVLLEAIRARTAPLAIITTEMDFFFALASVVADELYSTQLPLVALSKNDFGWLKSGDQIAIGDGGIIQVNG